MTEYLAPEYIPHWLATVAVLYVLRVRWFAPENTDKEVITLKSVIGATVAGASGIWWLV